MLLPPSPEELIAENHPVRVVNSVIDSLDLTCVLASYKGGGTSSYHPSVLLKIVVYAYLRNIYSSRRMEEAVCENIHFMWLAGGNRPDHNTLARFRSDRLRLAFREVFCQVVLLLAEAGLVSLDESYVDGTKFEAFSGRYSFVWGKSIKSKKEKIVEGLNEILAYAEQVCEQEMNLPPVSFDEVKPDLVQETVAKINEKLKGKEIPDEIGRKLKLASKAWPEALAVYENQEKILDGRGSYSKTDHDATFMRMKDDHLGKGQVKPGYNVQISTQNQIVTHYSVHPNPTDTLTLIPHLEGFKDSYGQTPENLIADAGYGSEQNYEYLASLQTTPYVNYSSFYRECKNGPDTFDPNHWPYNESEDSLICPAGKVLVRSGSHFSRTQAGFIQNYAEYQSPGCEGCPLREACFKDEGDRLVNLNHRLNEHRRKVRKLLESPEGLTRRKKRGCEVESVFGQVKQNKGCRRLHLKGKDKVSVEIGLIFLSHNIAKLAA